MNPLQKYRIKNFPFYCRPNTWDSIIVREVIDEDCYGLKKLKAQGVAPMVIFDIGGHIGSFTVYCRSLWPQVTLYSFEPLPANFEWLIKNPDRFPTRIVGEYHDGGACLNQLADHYHLEVVKRTVSLGYFNANLKEPI